MTKLALLMSTDDWNKVEIHRTFLSLHSRTVWRTQSRYSSHWVAQFKFPLRLYFFHRNEIRFSTTVMAIDRDEHWALDDIPPEFRSDPTPYRLFITMVHIAPIDPIHIWDFPKWVNPLDHFTHGQFGLLRVVDILLG